MKGQLQLREDLVRTRSLSVTRWMQPPELYRYFGPRSEDRYVGFKALETVNHAVNYGCPMISQVNLMLTMQNDAKLFEEYSQVLCECVIAATGVWFFYSWNWCTFSAMCQCVLKSPSSWLNWFGPWAWDIGSQMQGFSRIAWPQTRWGGNRIWYLWRCGYRKVYHGINVPVATDDEFFLSVFPDSKAAEAQTWRMQDGVTVALVQFLDALRIFEVLSSGDLEILIFIIFDPTFFSFCTCLVQICRRFWDGKTMLGRRGGPGRPVECCTFLERQINHSWSGNPCYQWQLESATDVRGAWEIPPIPARAIAWSWICILQLFFPYFSPYSDIQVPSSSFNFINILSTAIFWYWFELWSYLILIRYSIDICLWNILVSPWWRSHTPSLDRSSSSSRSWSRPRRWSWIFGILDQRHRQREPREPHFWRFSGKQRKQLLLMFVATVAFNCWFWSLPWP